MTGVDTALINVDETVQANLLQVFGLEITSTILSCNNDAQPGCDIRSFLDKLVEASFELRRSLDTCPAGCTLSQANCDYFYAATSTLAQKLRDECALTNSWPAKCVAMNRLLLAKSLDPKFDIAVVCGMVSPGINQTRLPTCGQLVAMTVATQKTLSKPKSGGCNFTSKEECLDGFCGAYETFSWRMRPRNLQDKNALFYYPKDFILAGCERFAANFPYDAAQCRRRMDINGYCDCLCGEFNTLVNPSGFDCGAAIDSYFLFARIGVTGIKLPSMCMSELCRVIGTSSSQPQCAPYNLPATRECLAYQFDKVPNASNLCPWLRNSRQNGVLTCLDGSKCFVDGPGDWACCTLGHLGRAQCPLDAPTMCNKLCSGSTEYCCMQIPVDGNASAACTPRGCSPLFQPQAIYLNISNYSIIDQLLAEKPGSGKNPTFTLVIPSSWWFWLVLLVPLLAMIAAVLYWRSRLRYRQLQKEVEEAERAQIANSESVLDKLGGYFVVHKQSTDDGATVQKRPIIHIEMPELPMVKPLGLELMETRVIRVHTWGEKNGWKVGDIIVDVGGHPVNTFEEIWDRIQIERDRCPVRFAVERWGIGPNSEERQAMRVAAGETGQSFSTAGKKSKVHPDDRDEDPGIDLEASGELPARELRDAARATSATTFASLRSGGSGGGARHPFSLDFEDEVTGEPEDDESGEWEWYEDDGTSSVGSANFRVELQQERMHVRPKLKFRSDFADAFPETGRRVKPVNEQKQFFSNPVSYSADAWGRSVMKVRGAPDIPSSNPFVVELPEQHRDSVSPARHSQK